MWPDLRNEKYETFGWTLEKLDQNLQRQSKREKMSY